MKQYLDLVREVLETGTMEKTRTGVDALSIDGAMMKFNHQSGFPIVTTKRVDFTQVKGELIAFMRGYTDIRDFHKLGVKIWDANLDADYWVSKRKDEYDLGKIYGYQWRNFNGVDQFNKLIDNIIQNPINRRLLVSAWNPAQLDQMALPPCHVSFQVIIKGDYLHLLMYQRSCDLFLGVPFNISSYCLLQALLAKTLGYKPGNFTHFLADVHIYEPHIELMKQQLEREPKNLPQLQLNFPHLIATPAVVEPDWIGLANYNHHPAIKAEMMV